MKKIATFLLAAFLVFWSLVAFANKWNDPVDSDQFYFSCQKDVEDNVDLNTESSASVTYQNKIFNFSCHISSNGILNHEIVVREVSYDAEKPTSPWSIEEGSHYTILSDYDLFVLFQPCPVVFNGTLYLFLSKQSGCAYITYLGNQTWSEPVDIETPLDLYNSAATVIGDYLCIMSWNWSLYKFQLNWTTDPTQPDAWQIKDFEGTVGSFVHNDEHQLYGISMITKNHSTTDGTIKQTLQLAYITPNNDARFAEYWFNDSGQPEQLQNIEIDSELKYSSAVLAEGSVYGDTKSTGECTQLFLKKNTKDNGYCRYRIERWQLKNGEWSRPEGNLVPQNSPKKMWADHYGDLTAVNYATPDPANTNRINQYIVLAYRGYDDYNHPFNIVWAQSDYMLYVKSENKSQNLNDDLSQRQYIGYIEGPPPFMVNDSVSYSIFPLNPYYFRGLDNPISEVVYSNNNTYEESSEMNLESSHKMSLHVGIIKPEIAYIHTSKDEFSEESTYSMEILIAAKEDNLGVYIYQAPLVTRSQYDVYDWNNTLLYPSYCFAMKEKYFVESDPLVTGLEANNPLSYMQINRGIDFAFYDYLATASNSWDEGIESATVGFENSSSTVTSNTVKKSFNLSIELGEIFENESERSMEYTTTTKTSQTKGMECVSKFNEPEEETDCVHLDYDVLWMLPTIGMDNWWAKDPDQDTWCITYVTTKMVLKDGTVFTDDTYVKVPNPIVIDEIEEETNPSFYNANTVENETLTKNFSLEQNYPNPFNSVSTFKYTLGENLPSEESKTYQTRLVVYNLNGKEIATLVNEPKAPGVYEVEWDASTVTPGFYFYSLESGNFKEVKKLIILE